MFKLYNFQEVENKTKDITLIFKKRLSKNTQLTNRLMFLNLGKKLFYSSNVQKSTIRNENIINIIYDSLDINNGLLKMSYKTKDSKDNYFERMVIFGQISKKEYLIIKKRYCKNINFEEF